MQACPICRASLNGASVCRRCRAELGKVQKIEQRGRMLAITAMRMLVEGDAGSAVRWIERARFVHVTPAVETFEQLMTAAGAVDPPE
jgi:hypothetical protein